MHSKTLPFARTLVLLVALLTLVGCTPATNTVTGKLVLPAGVTLKDNDSVTIALSPDSATAKGGAVPIFNHADLSFTVKDVTPGKYKITIAIQPYPGPDAGKRAATFDKINKENTIKDSKLTYEVTAEPKQEITVDLAKGKVTATKG